MKHSMPQEIEVWYLIPALRSELTHIFVKDYSLKQKEVAKLLGITESAVSQYLASKRGKDLTFSKKEQLFIRETAKKMVHEQKETLKHMYQLTVALRGSHSICALHRKFDKSIPKECEICMHH